MGPEIAVVRGLGEGDPLRVRLNSKLRDGRLVRRLDGEDIFSSNGNLGLRPMDWVSVCFLDDVGVVGAVFVDGKTTEGAKFEATTGDVGSDEVCTGYASLGRIS